jgi:hypothetical protein
MRYLLAIFLALSVVCGILAYYYHERANSYCELWKSTQANNEFLINQRRKDYENTIQISQRNRELEEEAKKDKSYFDWSADISNTAVIKRLQAN